MIVYEKTDKYIEWQRVTTSGTTSDNEWQRVTASDNKRQRVVQRVAKSDSECLMVLTNGNEWQRVRAMVKRMKTAQYTSKNGWLPLF